MTYKNILVAVSNNDEDNLLLRKAYEIARKFNAHLTAIHVDDGLSHLYPGVYSQFSEEMFDGLKNASDRRLFERLKEFTGIRLRVEQGTMPETLISLVQKDGFDLLICGHHHTFINRLMPAYRGLINKSTADLLIIPLSDA
ncbi:universal stress protein [Salmonella enterica]|uniref:universal stress protein n=1 Tax=Salmonella enterica TaxID=28901 RepID=UPI0026DD8DC5|nr:universal stress protein [Salmonella enterica]MDO3872079.1 universal stress protein [Salmonella enterica]MDO3886843.1 universal stress protein [Salmonella enterica]MDO3900036.1 universal stress protein [Salmonella enterica]MDO3976204.1 universal stress protein [Salmonella enterica]